MLAVGAAHPASATSHQQRADFRVRPVMGIDTSFNPARKS
jgi:hypothetical protein